MEVRQIHEWEGEVASNPPSLATLWTLTASVCPCASLSIAKTGNVINGLLSAFYLVFPHYLCSTSLMIFFLFLPLVYSNKQRSLLFSVLHLALSFTIFSLTLFLNATSLLSSSVSLIYLPISPAVFVWSSSFSYISHTRLAPTHDHDFMMTIPYPQCL